MTIELEHLQRADRRVDDREEQDGRNPGQHDAEEPPPVAGAVHDRRLDQRLRHALQRGDENDHEEAGVLPDIHDHDRHHGVPARCEPMDWGETEPDKVVIDDAEIVAVEIAPDDRHEGCGDDDRQEEGEPEQVEQDGRHLAVEREREQHADANIAGHCEDCKAQRIPKDLLRPVVGEKADVVVEPYPARTLHRVEIGKAQDAGDDDRSEDEREIEREGWQHEEIAAHRLGAVQFGCRAHHRRLHRSNLPHADWRGRAESRLSGRLSPGSARLTC